MSLPKMLVPTPPTLTMRMRRGEVALSPHRAVFTTHDPERGLLVSNRKAVCLMGAGCHHYPLLPHEEAQWELWGCNALWHTAFDEQDQFRADRWFEMHPHFAQSPSDLASLQRAPVDVYVLSWRDQSWVPRAVCYPRQCLAERQDTKASYASTFAYQIALAVWQGFSTIRLAGIYMNQGREALSERPNLLYWIGLAEGLGVTVELWTCDPDLVRHPYLYGYHYTEEKAYAEQRCRESLVGLARDGWRGSH